MVSSLTDIVQELGRVDSSEDTRGHSAAQRVTSKRRSVITCTTQRKVLVCISLTRHQVQHFGCSLSFPPTDDDLLGDLVRDHDGTNRESVSQWLGHGQHIGHTVCGEVLVRPQLSCTTQSTLTSRRKKCERSIDLLLLLSTSDTRICSL